MPSWQSSLSALDRYGAIRNIQASLSASTAATDAVSIEHEAFQTSSSLEEYKAACNGAAREPFQDAIAANQPSHDDNVDSPPGIRIGAYNGCVFISEGVTSQVFRCGEFALKVITSHRSMEPHNPQREAKILSVLRPPCIPLLDVFRDQEQQLVLRFPYMPLTLDQLLHDSDSCLSGAQLRAIFTDVLRALDDIHARGIIHRDIKPSAVLLKSPNGPAFLSDFGTAWHPDLSRASEPATDKILDIGTGPYRAPEVLFGNKAYGTPVDMWALGVMLAEAIRSPPVPPFESRPVDEDGNQLGLILSVFKTLGTPTPDTWPEARNFKVSPFELWTVFPPRPWAEILPDVDPSFRDLVAALVRYDGQRASATAGARPRIAEAYGAQVLEIREIATEAVAAGVILDPLQALLKI
ncbi:hypothetical protein HIM_10371 [Hirsutella minnesotensis 3608]|uniref:cyclin-dependent kinase n=1 Tax=Hirsutella minnesotensis 3608 TaxID=1043627 RepID=A0A0F7ZRU5_9HYPO|nr:hypothetical protein HIM_10371 [Hirsutella minnesotensis 3608]